MHSTIVEISCWTQNVKFKERNIQHVIAYSNSLVLVVVVTTGQQVCAAVPVPSAQSGEQPVLVLPHKPLLETTPHSTGVPPILVLIP